MYVKTLIKNFSNPGANSQNKPQGKKFMRQLYVAMSRPKTVLCLAVHKDSIAGYEDALRDLGWEIKIVNTPIAETNNQ